MVLGRLRRTTSNLQRRQRLLHVYDYRSNILRKVLWLGGITRSVHQGLSLCIMDWKFDILITFKHTYLITDRRCSWTIDRWFCSASIRSSSSPFHRVYWEVSPSPPHLCSARTPRTVSLALDICRRLRSLCRLWAAWFARVVSWRCLSPYSRAFWMIACWRTRTKSKESCPVWCWNRRRLRPLSPAVDWWCSNTICPKNWKRIVNSLL